MPRISESGTSSKFAGQKDNFSDNPGKSGTVGKSEFITVQNAGVCFWELC